MNFNRRKFLGFSCALTGFIYSCRWKDKLAGKAKKDREWKEGIETFANSICSECSGGCGLTFRLVDGIVVGVEGNNFFPLNRGKLCTKAYSAIDSLYSDKMFTSPLFRDKKGGSLRKITWEEAITILSEKLLNLQESGNSKKLLMLSGAEEGSVKSLWELFFKAFNSPDFYTITDNHRSLNSVTSSFFFGNNEGFDYDFEKSSYILSFGAHLYESFVSPVYNMKVIKGTSDKNVIKRVVHIESLSSITAGASDDFIFIRPGTYNILALGILNVILQEGRYDKRFIERYAKNFKKFFNFVVRNFYPSMVSKATGIDKKSIIKIAREFANAKNQVAVLGDDMSYHSNGISSYIAVMALNICLGRIDKPGGIVFPRNDFSYDTPKPPNKYFSSFAISENIKNKNSSKTEIAMLYKANQIFSNPEHMALKRAISEIPFIVSFSSLPCYESLVSDLILPATSPLTQLEDVSVSLNTHKIFAVKKPLAAIKGVKNTGDIIVWLSKILKDKNKFPVTNYKDFLKERVRKIYESKKGYLLTKVYETAFQKVLLSDGYHYEDSENFDEFYEILNESGGWHEPVYFYEDYNRVLKEKIDFFKTHLSEHYSTLPSYKESKKLYPLSLNIYFPPHYSFSGTSNINQGNSIRRLRHNETKDYIAEINHNTAKKFNLKNKNSVILETQEGKISMRLSVNKGVAEDVVNIEIPPADYIFNRKNVIKNEKIFKLLKLNVSDVINLASISSTRVKIRKA